MKDGLNMIIFSYSSESQFFVCEKKTQMGEKILTLQIYQILNLAFP